MTMAATEAQGEEIDRAASPASDFFLRRSLGAWVVFSISAVTLSGIAMGSRVLMAQASFRIWTMLYATIGMTRMNSSTASAAPSPGALNRKLWL